MYKGLKRLRSPFIFPEEGESKRNPLSLFRGKAMDTPQTKHRPCNHPPELNAPRTFEKRPRLRRGGVQGGPLLQDHSPKVSRTQQRPSTHRALMAHGRWVSSPLWSQEPPPPPPLRQASILTPQALRSAHYPQAGRAAFHPHFSRAGDGKHESTNRAVPRTTCTQWGLVGGTAVHQSELSRCGVQCPKRGSFRLVSPGSFSPINWFRGPLSRGTAPLPVLLWSLRETLQWTSAQNTSSLRRGHAEPLPDPERAYSVTRGSGSHGNAFFTFPLSMRGVTLGMIPERLFAVSFLSGSASRNRDTREKLKIPRRTFRWGWGGTTVPGMQRTRGKTLVHAGNRSLCSAA